MATTMSKPQYLDQFFNQWMFNNVNFVLFDNHFQWVTGLYLKVK